jgi:thiamine biosynthesis lipoprotein
MKEFRISRKLMGCAFELILVHDNEQEANRYLDAGVEEIIRLENLLTEFDENSETSLINRFAGVAPVTVGEETYHLIDRCIRLSVLTQGAFDITVGGLKKLYQFNNGAAVFPENSILKHALSNSGYHRLEILQGQQIFLNRKGMRLSFNAIGKGYAADCVKKNWQEAGILNGVINASGDLTAMGTNAHSESWKIGIADPENPEQILCYLPVENASVATSGNYEQYFIKDGVRYGHTINPRTGFPVTGIKSVSIVGPSAALCDALATAVYVMGTEIGMHLVNQLPGTHCLIIDDKNRLHKSANFNLQHVEK